MHFFVCRDNLFTEEELKKITKYCDSLFLNESKVMLRDSLSDSTDYRKSDQAFIGENENNSWLFEKLRLISLDINDETFNYDLTGFNYLQYAEYCEGDHFEFHMDTMFAQSSLIDIPRKLSFSIILSDNDEYEGGQFQFYTGGKEPTTIKQAKGRVIAFPSWMVHRVTPIKSGVRKSLVFWQQGPKFK
jgi:PKHD-type hydroxylase